MVRQGAGMRQGGGAGVCVVRQEVKVVRQRGGSGEAGGGVVRQGGEW